MSRRSPSLFRQADVAKALKAAASAGVTITRVEIGKDGRIVMVTNAGEASSPDDLDQELSDWEARRGR